MTGARVLVVDDELPNRDMLSRRLARQGLVVVTAASGAEALEVLDREAWSAVLLDVQMPVMSGLEVLARIRARWSPAELPVLMVTARDSSEDIVTALEQGANDYVTKPVDFPVALARLKTQLARKEAEDRLRVSEERYALAAKGANDGLWDWDLTTGVLHVSDRWRAIVGGDLEAGRPAQDAYLDRVHGEDRTRVQRELEAHLAGETPHLQSEHRVMYAPGAFRWVLVRGMAVRRADGTPVRMAGSLSDVTLEKVVDALTGLPNRMSLHDRMERALQPALVGEDHGCAVLLLDLDGFKLIYDGHGQRHGDELLKAVARRLEGALRLGDVVARPLEVVGDHTIARLGGDEFVVVLHGVRDDGLAVRVAERLQRALARPFSVCDREVFLSASIGIAVSGPNATPDDLLRNADTALTRARAQGRGRIEVFALAMREQVLERLQLDAALRVALERREFVAHYQPIIALADGRLVGFEALMRWRATDGRLVPPAAFIPALEDSGLIVPVGRQFAEDVCRQLAAWRRAMPGGPPLWVNLNVTSSQVAEPDLLETLLAAIAKAGLAPQDVVVEITESMAISDVARAAATLDRFRAAGVRVVLDDFGTGYSSLACLHELPISGLKLDRSFIGSERRHPAILRAIVQLAESLGLTVTAEGIETPAQHDELRALGCGFAQGYLFSRPVEAAAAAELIRRHATWLPAAQASPAA
jgi:diguanylate cyclase (GGDEF)-like protein/PAS domain S-box-containing protein